MASKRRRCFASATATNGQHFWEAPSRAFTHSATSLLSGDDGCRTGFPTLPRELPATDGLENPAYANRVASFSDPVRLRQPEI